VIKDRAAAREVNLLRSRRLFFGGHALHQKKASRLIVRVGSASRSPLL
jgi:hypothetical protein